METIICLFQRAKQKEKPRNSPLPNSTPPMSTVDTDTQEPQNNDN